MSKIKIALRELREENEQLKTENAYLKNRMALLESQKNVLIQVPVPACPIQAQFYPQYPNIPMPYNNPFWC